MYHSTYRPLTVEEQSVSSIQQDMITCRESAMECLGPKLTHNKLEEVGIPDTSEYISYADKDQDKVMFLDLDEEVSR